MPIQFEWQPNTQPVPKGTDIGLLIYGDESTLPALSNGRVRIVEIPATGKGAGSEAAERTIATFHGRFNRNAGANAANRITFEILRRPTDTAHNGEVFGFDPECMYGIDFFKLTFVNRQFVIFFPFHTDVRSEGDFLELQALAEIPDQRAEGGIRVLARSMTRTLTNREAAARVVSTTTDDARTNTKISYTGKMVGYNITVQEEYLLACSVQPAGTPVFVPVNKSSGIPFERYQDGNLRVVLLTELLDELAPSVTFCKNQFPGQDPAFIIDTAKKELRPTIPPRVKEIFEDAGFSSASIIWHDEPAATNIMNFFTGSFTKRRGLWGLLNDQSPLVISFWTFIVTHNPSLGVAARAERARNAGVVRTINGRQLLLTDSLPIGNNKRLTEPIGIACEAFQKIVTEASGGFRPYKNIDEFKDAVRVMGRKVGATIAHEVAHSLGMQHTALAGSGNAASEKDGAPVLTASSEDLRGHIGPLVRFSMQAKVIWANLFGVSPTLNDTSLQNKTWNTSEVPTLGWADRKQRFQVRNGELRFSLPLAATGTSGVPPFAIAPPGTPQRGTR